MKISEILKSEENIGAMIAFQLSLYSSFFWVLTAIVYFSGNHQHYSFDAWRLVFTISVSVGLSGVISPEMESLCQCSVDLLMKCFYAYALCSSHSAILSPEGRFLPILRCIAIHL